MFISCFFPLVSQNTTGSSQGWEYAGIFQNKKKKWKNGIGCPLLLYLSLFSFFFFFPSLGGKVGAVIDFYQKLPF